MDNFLFFSNLLKERLQEWETNNPKVKPYAYIRFFPYLSQTKRDKFKEEKNYKKTDIDYSGNKMDNIKVKCDVTTMETKKTQRFIEIDALTKQQVDINYKENANNQDYNELEKKKKENNEKNLALFGPLKKIISQTTTTEEKIVNMSNLNIVVNGNISEKSNEFLVIEASDECDLIKPNGKMIRIKTSRCIDPYSNYGYEEGLTYVVKNNKDIISQMASVKNL